MQTDPSTTNKTRAQRAETVLQNYIEAKGEVYEASSPISHRGSRC
jgi:hypothetical protein